MTTVSHPTSHDITPTVRAAIITTADRVREERDHAAWRADWIRQVGGRPGWWQARADRLGVALERLTNYVGDYDFVGRVDLPGELA